MSAPATIPALRGAILSGRRVLVVTAGRLEPYAREAAVVAGREGELRVLHVGTAPHAPFRVRPDSRANPTANVVYGTDLMADLADVPVADATDLAAAGILVVLHAEGGRVEDAHVCEAMRAFARRGPDRAVFCVEPPDLVGAPVPVGAWPGGRTFPLDALAAMPGLAPATGATAHALGWSRTAWDAALENCMAGTESGEDIGRERAAWVASPDRLALVVREAGALAAYEVGPDGWCEVGAVLQPDLGDMSAAVVARAVWRGGLARASIRLDWHGGPRAGAPNPVHRLLVLREACTPVRDAIDAALARMDVQLLTALGSGPGAHALFRTVVAGAGPARRDFALTWPAFAAALADPDVRAAVDRGGRTAPVVADLIGTTPGIARRLVGRDRMPACCHLPGDDMAALSPHRIPLGHLLDALGPGALPLTADRAGWTGFLACCMTLEAVLERGRVADPAPAVCAGLLLGGGADWNARRDSQLQPGRPSPTGAGDMVAAFAGFLSAAAGRRIPANAALALLAGRWSLARLLAASLAFHADPRLSSGLGEIPDRVTWPVPFAPYAVRGGWSVTVLSNPRQLRDEGAHGPDADGVDGLGHCVGGYARACWSGESLVLSVRRSADGRTRRVSTAELRPDPDGTWRLGTRVYALHQHSARGNATPPPEAVGVLARLRAALAMGEVPVDEAALTPRIGEPEMGSPRERAEALHGAWRAVMPRALARLDLDVLVALAVPEDPGLAA